MVFLRRIIVAIRNDRDLRIAFVLLIVLLPIVITRLLPVGNTITTPETDRLAREIKTATPGRSPGSGANLSLIDPFAPVMDETGMAYSILETLTLNTANIVACDANEGLFSMGPNASDYHRDLSASVSKSLCGRGGTADLRAKADSYSLALAPMQRTPGLNQAEYQLRLVAITDYLQTDEGKSKIADTNFLTSLHEVLAMISRIEPNGTADIYTSLAHESLKTDQRAAAEEFITRALTYNSRGLAQAAPFQLAGLINVFQGQCATAMQRYNASWALARARGIKTDSLRQRKQRDQAILARCRSGIPFPNFTLG